MTAVLSSEREAKIFSLQLIRSKCNKMNVSHYYNHVTLNKAPPSIDVKEMNVVFIHSHEIPSRFMNTEADSTFDVCFHHSRAAHFIDFIHSIIQLLMESMGVD